MSIKGGRFREWWDVPAKVELRKLRQVCPAQYDTVSKQTQPTKQNQRNQLPNNHPTTMLEGELHVYQMAKILLILRGIFCLWQYKLVQPFEKTSNVY